MDICTNFKKNNMTKLGYIEMIREKAYEASREVLKFSSAYKLAIK